MSINHKALGQTCGLLPVGVGSTVLTTRGLRWNLGAPALVTCLSIADHRSNFDGMISTSNHHVPEEPVVYVKTTGGRSSCDPKPLPEYHRPRTLPIHLCSISVRSRGASGKLYTDASGPAIKFSNETNLFHTHHHPACCTLIQVTNPVSSSLCAYSLKFWIQTPLSEGVCICDLMLALLSSSFRNLSDLDPHKVRDFGMV